MGTELQMLFDKSTVTRVTLSQYRAFDKPFRCAFTPKESKTDAINRSHEEAKQRLKELHEQAQGLLDDVHEQKTLWRISFREVERQDVPDDSSDDEGGRAPDEEGSESNKEDSESDEEDSESDEEGSYSDKADNEADQEVEVLEGDQQEE